MHLPFAFYAVRNRCWVAAECLMRVTNLSTYVELSTNLNLIHRNVNSYIRPWCRLIYVCCLKHKCSTGKLFAPLSMAHFIHSLIRHRFGWIDLICCFNAAAVHLLNIDTWLILHSSPRIRTPEEKNSTIEIDRWLFFSTLFHYADAFSLFLLPIWCTYMASTRIMLTFLLVKSFYANGNQQYDK